jgi:ribosomal protein S13
MENTKFMESQKVYVAVGNFNKIGKGIITKIIKQHNGLTVVWVRLDDGKTHAYLESDIYTTVDELLDDLYVCKDIISNFNNKIKLTKKWQREEIDYAKNWR